jgi:hypothetical protein
MPRYAMTGFEVEECGIGELSDWPHIDTTWAKRLRDNSRRQLLFIVARATALADPRQSPWSPPLGFACSPSSASGIFLASSTGRCSPWGHASSSSLPADVGDRWLYQPFEVGVREVDGIGVSAGVESDLRLLG